MSVAYGETGLEVRHIVVKRTIIEIFNLTSVFDFCLAIGDYEVGFSSKLLFIIWAVVALLVIALYWVLWIRQYKKGNHFEDIYGTGIPLFIIPAAFVLVTGIFSMNFMLIIFSVLDIVCEYCSAYGVRKRLHPAKTEESSDEAEKKENEDGE